MNGEFDSKNAYLLAIDEDPEAPDFHGKWIWKLKTLPKIQIFLWKCMHLRLPVKSILALRGIFGLGGYENYSDIEESITHILRDCPIAKKFWGRSSCPSSLKTILFWRPCGLDPN